METYDYREINNSDMSRDIYSLVKTRHENSQDTNLEIK